MLKWLFLIGAFVLAWWWWSGIPAPDNMKRVDFDNRGESVWGDSAEVSSTRDLNSKVNLGAYTLVEIYNDSCSICQGLKEPLARLVQMRRDVSLVVLALPTMPRDCIGYIEAERAERCMQIGESVVQEFKRLGVCHTPHVAIFNPKGKAIAEDTCEGRDGLRFLQDWLRAEGAA